MNLRHGFRIVRAHSSLLGLWLFIGVAAPASAQLFSNLMVFNNRLPVGDPDLGLTNRFDGPKDVAIADLDRDGKADLAVSDKDGSVTLYYGKGDGTFSAPAFLHTRGRELRGIVAANVAGGSLPDLIVASPYESRLYLFVNTGGRTFSAPRTIKAWWGARDLAAGDFDGDGRTDLAVAGWDRGVAQFRNINNNGSFSIVTNIASIAQDTNDANDFPKPAYYLRAYRPRGATRDQLLVARAMSSKFRVLGADIEGVLTIQGTLSNLLEGSSVNSFDVGPLLRRASSTVPDLVLANHDTGRIEIHPGTNTPVHFMQSPAVSLQIPGGPRTLRIVDLDRDGWNDLVVVLQNRNAVLVYRNTNGTLITSSVAPVGCNPREMVAGDFNKDGLPDLAVLNRYSADLSILLTQPGQAAFRALDQVYPVDGAVAGLTVQDFNRDGYDDVIQLHMSSGDFSVRLANTNGTLSPPKFYTIGNRPAAHQTVDVNNDGIADLVTVDLGGSVSVRLGLRTGQFGPSRTFALPPDAAGGLFALQAADFDGDGNIDLAAGYYDCRLAFFRGYGDGSFQHTTTHFFTVEARAMAVGDFDQDGDIDLCGAGYKGDFVVVENRGDLLTTPTLARQDYPKALSFGPRVIRVEDFNKDGDLDVIIGDTGGANLFLGGPGVTFERASNTFSGPQISASSIALADFDNDGNLDMITACDFAACINVFKGTEDGQFVFALNLTVPSSRFIATGDLDGDGLPDLVGTGDVLWTALSSRAARSGPPPPPDPSRDRLPKPVINELLAINSSFAIALDGGRSPDWVEIYNGGATNLALAGWALQLVVSEATETGGSNTVSFKTNTFVCNTNALLQPGSNFLFVCSDHVRSPLHTGFNLPGEGATLILLDPAGNLVDQVDYPAQQEDVSYARYRDGLPSFIFNTFPTPGAPNEDNGLVQPVAQFDGFEVSTAQPDTPILFRVTGRDDVGIVSVTLVYQRLDLTNEPSRRILLVDDGMSEDGGRLDGLFAGRLPALPAGAQIQFYLEITDLSDQIITIPDEPVFARPGEQVTMFSMVIGGPVPSIEISEVVADNKNGLHDETGGTPDWVEIRNCGTESVSLANLTLAPQFFGTKSRYAFPTNRSLAPGEHLVIYCDSNPSQGPLHAPFNLNRDGEELMLTGSLSNNVRTLVSSVKYGPLPEDMAWARLGCAGQWRLTTPTPLKGNMIGAWESLLHDGQFTFGFPAVSNFLYTVEAASELAPGAWAPVKQVTGNGVEQTVTEPLQNGRFFRVRRQ